MHHIAFRTPNDDTQLAWREVIARHLSVTTVQDRDYFQSIYFREPGGVLFEMATDTPGFAIDEPIETLGEALCVPAWLEPQRAQLLQRLAPLTLPQGGAGMSSITTNHPHAAGELLYAGVPLDAASGAVILLHGRGASAADILSLASPLELPGVAYVAPQAVGHSWYPQSFLAPREQNEPWLSSALERIEQVICSLESAGLTRAQVVLCGFSQGACLASEFVASHPARYAGVIAFTGGLVGPPGSDLQHAGDLEGTPVLLSSGDPDPHVPWVRVQQTAEELSRMGAQVTADRYPRASSHDYRGRDSVRTDVAGAGLPILWIRTHRRMREGGLTMAEPARTRTACLGRYQRGKSVAGDGQGVSLDAALCRGHHGRDGHRHERLHDS